MTATETNFWPQGWSDPSLKRAEKPRSTGLTMVIDKGLGLTAAEDLFSLAADYIDTYKLGFGTSALYPLHLLRQKVELAKSYNIKVMPGGTFFELVSLQADFEDYLAKLKLIGFNAIEISDGTFPLSREDRLRVISQAADAGFTVFTEFGKKAADFRVELDGLLQTLEDDLAAGATCVIVEARESGTVGVFDRNGKIDSSFLERVTEAAGENARRLIWEAPQKEQQVALLRSLGLDVNLGNIAPTDVLSVETLRRGLRGDTSNLVLEQRSSAVCE